MQYNRANIILSANGVGTTGYTHTKKKIYTEINLSQKLIPSGSCLKCKAKTP